MLKAVIVAHVEDSVKWEKSFNFRKHGDLSRSQTDITPINFWKIGGNQIAVCFGLCAFLVFSVPCFATPAKGVVEGYVRNQDGKPLRGATITVDTGRSTGSETIVIPIVTKSTVGAVGATFPASGWDNLHLTHTDKKGH